MTQTLTTSALGDWLWEAACVIRGPIDAPKFKDYILPLIFIKRLSGVFEEVLPLEEVLVELAEAEEERAEADKQLREVLKSLGLSLSTPSMQESP